MAAKCLMDVGKRQPPAERPHFAQGPILSPIASSYSGTLILGETSPSLLYMLSEGLTVAAKCWTQAMEVPREGFAHSTEKSRGPMLQATDPLGPSYLLSHERREQPAATNTPPSLTHNFHCNYSGKPQKREQLSILRS